MIAKKMSVTRTVLITLVLVTTFVLAAFGISAYFRERAARMLELQVELKVTSAQIASSLTLPLWNFDREQVDKIIESAMQNRQIFAVVVKEANSAGIASARERDRQWRIVPAAGGEITPTKNLLLEKTDISFSGKQLGSVFVHMSPRFIEEELRSFLIHSALGIVTLNASLVTILF